MLSSSGETPIEPVTGQHHGFWVFQVSWGVEAIVFRACADASFLVAFGACPEPACRGGVAHGSTVRGPAWRGGSSFLTGPGPGR
jgi:hypothetical protein